MEPVITDSFSSDVLHETFLHSSAPAITRAAFNAAIDQIWKKIDRTQ